MSSASRTRQRRAERAPQIEIAPGLTRNDALARFEGLREHQRVCHERGYHQLDRDFERVLHKLAFALDAYV